MRKRETKETKIELEIGLYGSGKSDIKSGIAFFDHMLESFSKHSLIDLYLRCEGDIEVDFHHSVEDVGIVLGEELRAQTFPIEGVERFGNSAVVMDESVVECDLDLSNRAFLYFDIGAFGNIGEFDCELVEEFFRALVVNYGISAHIVKKRGKNRHHIVEAAFKSFAISLRRALSKNSAISTPSTKGVL